MRLRIREVLVRKSDDGLAEFEVPFGWDVDQVIDFNPINFKLILVEWLVEDEMSVEEAIRREESERFALI